jgi:hypothetical protein
MTSLPLLFIYCSSFADFTHAFYFHFLYAVYVIIFHFVNPKWDNKDAYLKKSDPISHPCIVFCSVLPELNSVRMRLAEKMCQKKNYRSD